MTGGARRGTTSMSDHTDTRAFISSLIERLGTLEKLAEEMPNPRKGNGWEPSRIAETVAMVLPQSLDRIARKAMGPGISARIADFFRPKYAASRIGSPATLIYLPIWHVKGYHECFYLRNAKYTIPVDKDVVAVEVDGETRDLMIEEQESRIVPEALKRRLQRFSGLFTGQRRYFSLNDVVELAVRSRRAEMYVTPEGREGDLLEEVLPHGWRTQRIFEVAQLNVEGVTTRIASSEETKESVVERFKNRYVEMPETPRQVLSNTFQIEELAQFYIPYVRFAVMRGGRLDDVIVNAASAKIPDGKTVDFVKRQLHI